MGKQPTGDMELLGVRGMSDYRLLAETMKEWSDTAGDHHWQAGCAIDRLTAENEALQTETKWQKSEIEALRAEVDSIRWRDAERDANVINQAPADFMEAFGDIRETFCPACDFHGWLKRYAAEIKQKAKES